jgi:hypothetical protein
VLGGDLGAGEPDHQRGLRGRRGGLDLFGEDDGVDPGRVHRPIALGRVCDGGVSQLAQPGQHPGQLGTDRDRAAISPGRRRRAVTIEAIPRKLSATTDSSGSPGTSYFGCLSGGQPAIRQ